MTALIILGLADLLFVLPHHMLGDAPVRYETLVTLLQRGDLTPARHSLIGPLFAFGELVGEPERWAESFNSLFFALSLLLFYLLLRTHLPGALIRRFLLVLIAGSMLPAHVVGFDTEVFSALAVAVGLTAVAVRRAPRAGWAAVVLGVANTPAAALGVALVVARRCLETRRLRYGLILAAAMALIVGENWLRRGSPFAGGYAGDARYKTVMPYSGLSGFSYPFLLGLLALGLSFGKGLLFFAPGLLMPVRSRMRELSLGGENTLFRLYGWWLLFLAGLVLVYAPWWSWYGGVTWGPRFLLFASIPAALALAVKLWDLESPLWARGLSWGAWLLSCWVALCGAAFFEAAYPPQCLRDGYALEALCHFTPEFSVLWYPLVAHLEINRRELAFVAYIVVVFVYLAGPLVASIGADLARRVPQALGRYKSNWGF